MKYKTENEFCIETTKNLIGLCIDGSSHFLCVPEVPKGFFSNNHTDMLIINKTEKKMVGIEYKLKDIDGLVKQVDRNKCIRAIGIINKQISDDYNYAKVYGMTGEDHQWEILHKELLTDSNIPSLKFWTSVHESSWARLYWYAYLNNENDFSGGLKNSGSKTFHHIYMQAIENLQKEFDNKLDFMIVNAVFDVGYSESTARRYYNKAMREIKK